MCWRNFEAVLLLENFFMKLRRINIDSPFLVLVVLRKYSVRFVN
jgi:hypothetical protein